MRRMRAHSVFFFPRVGEPQAPPQAPPQDANSAEDMAAAARAELARHLDEVAAVLLERLEAGVPRCRLHAAVIAAAELVDLGLHPRRCNAGLLECVGDLGILEEAY